MANPKLIVEIAGDSSKLRRELKRSEAESARFAKNLKGASAGAGGLGFADKFAAARGPAAAAALAIGLAAKESLNAVQAASNLNEQMTKSDQVFGKASESVEKWSKTTATAFGISRTAALEATGTFGNLFNTVGISGEKAAGMSQQLVQLAADLASFNNANPTDTLDALRSGLVGEAEPLRRFGVLLSEARVQQQAMTDTGKKSKTALTDQEKALARYEIILSDTGKAQGDFSRTSDGLANQQRILRARLADTEAELGTKLLPIMLKATEAANKFLGAFQTAQAGVQDFANPEFLKKFQDSFGIEALVDALHAMAPQIKQAREQFEKDVEKLGRDIDPFNKPGRNPAPFGSRGFKVGTAPPVPLGPSVQKKNQFFDDRIARQIDRNQDIGSLKGQVADLNKIAAEIEKRIAVTKDITRKLNLEDELVSVRRQSRGLSEQIVADAKERTRQQKQLAKEAREQAIALAEERKEAEKQRKEAKLVALASKQFRELGLSASGDPITPGVANLKKRVASLRQNVEGTKFDTPKLQSQLKRFAKVLNEGLVPKDVRAKINDLLDGIAGDVKSFQDKLGKQGGPLTKTTTLNANKVLEGLGLSPADERQLKARLSHFNSAGVALAGAGRGGTPLQRAGSQREITVHVPDIFIDGRKVTSNVSGHQARNRRRNPSQRRGPSAGQIRG